MKKQITWQLIAKYIVVLLIFVIIVGFNNMYTIINGKIYETNLKRIEIDFNKSKIGLNNLKYLNKLEALTIYSASKENKLNDILQLEALEEVNINYSEIHDMTFINSLTNLRELYFLASYIDFSNISNSNLKKIDITSCELVGIENLSEFQNLEEIHMYNIDVVDIHSISTVKNIKSLYLGKIGEIRNIEKLSALETIERLAIYDSNFDMDYTILCDMPNLKYVGLSKNTINNEEKNILQEKGIYVKIYTEE